jgi:hypothetical protein
MTWLCIAVLIKTVSFALLERRLSITRAIALMLAANVLSTIPGLLTAVFAGALSLFTLPVVFLLGKLAERRISLLADESTRKPFTGKGLALAFTAAFFVSVVMFSLAGIALDDRNFATYWVFKILFATVAVCVGMGISTVLEEGAIARMVRRTHPQTSFYPSVVRANYITLGTVLLVAAVQILPKRLHSPNFIVSWLHNLASSLGMA